MSIGSGAEAFLLFTKSTLVSWSRFPSLASFEREQFLQELKIYQTFAQNQPCPSIVQCFHFSERGFFLECMRDMSLSSRIQNNHTRDRQTMVVTSVEKYEPLQLQLQWMNDLAQAIGFLESLNLAHGDLRPENVLLDRDQLKLSDFDCTAQIGTKYEACLAPYGRILNHEESDQGECGTFGLLGPRTEQFALGSLFYLINYGFEVYGDRCLTDDAHDHGPRVVELLQDKKFPKLDGIPLIDRVIEKCWQNKYVKASDTAADTKTLLSEIDAMESKGTINTETDSWGLNMDQGYSHQDFLSEQKFCQDLEKQGLLEALAQGEPEEIV
ncbi:hypothetical protein N7493_000985 [Penicillium malachiteum]|uniref:Protein kinase domain-containing protein n=1 Tax=Penicillium malachiteum TaxID=1324776 RepID=A0AAD6HXD1_9EURO|nr:hypothetical protein N7493_000985 [Penicillium malachiteum]